MNVTLRTWFELTRISNLPSVVTSSLVGVFMITPLALDSLLVFGVVLPLLLAIACIYLGGFVLNDVFDLEVDRVERPGRPLPSGRVSVFGAGRLAATLMCSALVLVILGELVGARAAEEPDGLQIAFPRGLVAALLLVVLVFLYDRFHTRSAWWVLAMGGCRGMVYVTCLLVMTDQLEFTTPRPLVLEYLTWPNLIALPVVPFILSMSLYVAAFSLIARGEVRDEQGEGVAIPRWLRNGCLACTFLPLVTLMVVKLAGGLVAWSRNSEAVMNSPLFRGDMLMTVVSSGLAAVWFILAWRRYLARPHSPGGSIQMWIAGIALLDAVYLIQYGQGILSVACLLLFAVTVWGHRRIKGT